MGNSHDVIDSVFRKVKSRYVTIDEVHRKIVRRYAVEDCVYKLLWKNGGKYIAGGSMSTNEFAISEDGMNWTAITPNETTTVTSFAYGNGILVKAYTSSKSIWYSEDEGVTWNTGNVPTPSSSGTTGWSVCFGNGKFIAMPYSSGCPLYSIDGVNWTEISITTSDGGTSFSKTGPVKFLNGRFFNINNSYPYSSEDGVTWVRNGYATLSGDSSHTFYDMVYAFGKYITVGDGDLFYSTDGIVWTKYGSGYGYGYCMATDGEIVISANNRGFRYFGSDYVAGAGSGATSGTFRSAAYSDKFVAVGDSGVGAYSFDGVTWTTITMPSSGCYYKAICYME